MLLLDPLAWIFSIIGELFQWLAGRMSSGYFTPLSNSHLSKESKVQELQLLFQDVNNESLKVFKQPMPLMLLATRGKHSVYCGETCIVMGTLEECDKFVSGLLFMLLRKGMQCYKP